MADDNPGRSQPPSSPSGGHQTSVGHVLTPCPLPDEAATSATAAASPGTKENGNAHLTTPTTNNHDNDNDQGNVNIKMEDGTNLNGDDNNNMMAARSPKSIEVAASSPGNRSNGGKDVQHEEGEMEDVVHSRATSAGSVSKAPIETDSGPSLVDGTDFPILDSEMTLPATDSLGLLQTGFKDEIIGDNGIADQFIPSLEELYAIDRQPEKSVPAYAKLRLHHGQDIYLTTLCLVTGRAGKHDKVMQAKYVQPSLYDANGNPNEDEFVIPIINTGNLDLSRVSRRHLRISFDNSGWKAECLPAKGFITVNGKMFGHGQPAKLEDNYIIGFGPIHGSFLLPEPEGSDAGNENRDVEMVSDAQSEATLASDEEDADADDDDGEDIDDSSSLFASREASRDAGTPIPLVPLLPNGQDDDSALMPPPAVKRGRGRPPKNGVTSVREQKAIKKKMQEEWIAQGKDIADFPSQRSGSSAAKEEERVQARAEKEALKKAKLEEREAKLREKQAAKDSKTQSKPMKERKKKPVAPRPPESDFTPEQLAKPLLPYTVLIFDAIVNAGPKGLTLPEIYRSLEATYPYFRVKAETNGWQSSVRHNLRATGDNGLPLFMKGEKAGKGFNWLISPGGSVDRDRKKRRAVNSPTLSHATLPTPSTPTQLPANIKEELSGDSMLIDSTWDQAANPGFSIPDQQTQAQTLMPPVHTALQTTPATPATLIPSATSASSPSPSIQRAPQAPAYQAAVPAQAPRQTPVSHPPRNQVAPAHGIAPPSWDPTRNRQAATSRTTAPSASISLDEAMAQATAVYVRPQAAAQRPPSAPIPSAPRVSASPAQRPPQHPAQSQRLDPQEVQRLVTSIPGLREMLNASTKRGEHMNAEKIKALIQRARSSEAETKASAAPTAARPVAQRGPVDSATSAARLVASQSSQNQQLQGPPAGTVQPPVQRPTQQPSTPVVPAPPQYKPQPVAAQPKPPTPVANRPIAQATSVIARNSPSPSTSSTPEAKKSSSTTMNRLLEMVQKAKAKKLMEAGEGGAGTKRPADSMDVPSPKRIAI